MKKRYLQYGEKQIHIRELEPSGNENGNPILCLHPSPYSGLFFETIMPMINKNRKIIAPDYLGYGSSSSIESPPSINDYAASIGEVLNQVGNYEQYNLIGFHTGCLVANELCLLIPDKIDQIIMIEGKQIKNSLNDEKVKTHNIFMNINKTLGLYLIQNNKNGERNFFYWRSNSAARTLLKNVNSKVLFKQISKYDAIYFSGITLSIYDQKSNEKFC